jgi:fermentation-respiration switch protein FrsA (DUF1100 family)
VTARSALEDGRARLGTLLGVLALRPVPFWERSWRRRVARWVVFLVYGYLGVLLVLLFLETRLLFRPTKYHNGWYAPPTGLIVEDVNLHSADGTPLHAWWAAPEGWQPAQGALVYCHGNGGNLSYCGEIMMTCRNELRCGVLVFDYPGYGRSGGKPSEAGCYAAADAAYDWVVQEKKVSGADLLLVGDSLGGAMATDLATRRAFRALVLMKAFSSFPDIAQKVFPWLPARWLVRTRFDNVKKIATVRGPVFIAHGTADGLVPFSHGERLFAAAQEPKAFLPLAGQDHNDPPGRDFYQALREFLARTRQVARAPAKGVGANTD